MTDMVRSGGVLAVVLVSMSLAGCDKRPEGVLSDATMRDVFVDLHKADAYVDTEVSAAADDSLHKAYMQGVFAKHGISRAEFDSTLAWYGHHVDKFDAVYDGVIEQLSQDLGRAPEVSGKSEGNELWHGETRMLLLPGSEVDQLTFTVDSTQVKRGDRLVWEFKTIAPQDAVTTFVGVDYSDGSTAYMNTRHYSREKVSVTFQCDSSLVPVRAYGYARYNGGVTSPVVVDSISLTLSPLNAKGYYDVYNQRHFKARAK